jgi:hypothetical protein
MQRWFGMRQTTRAECLLTRHAPAGYEPPPRIEEVLIYFDALHRDPRDRKAPAAEGDRQVADALDVGMEEGYPACGHPPVGDRLGTIGESGFGAGGERQPTGEEIGAKNRMSRSLQG